jgi:transcriptional regulator with XRE-family HTH domain
VPAPKDDAGRKIDVAVGRRIKLRRRLLGMSQAKLAEAIGVSFQQLQKYEAGENRVSSVYLYQLAVALQAPIGYFFEDFPLPPDTPAFRAALEADLPAAEALTRAGVALMQSFSRIRDPGVRRMIANLVSEIAEREP